MKVEGEEEELRKMQRDEYKDEQEAEEKMRRRDR